MRDSRTVKVCQCVCVRACFLLTEVQQQQHTNMQNPLLHSLEINHHHHHCHRRSADCLKELIPLTNQTDFSVTRNTMTLTRKQRHTCRAVEATDELTPAVTWCDVLTLEGESERERIVLFCIPRQFQPHNAKYFLPDFGPRGRLRVSTRDKKVYSRFTP